MVTMKAQTFIALILCMSYSTLYAEITSRDICDDTKQPISKVINSLSVRLANQIGGHDNYFFSPLSISMALGMVYLGARGTTKNQMTIALQYKEVGKGCLSREVSKCFKDLLESLESKNGERNFLIANGAFLQQGYSVLPDYTYKLQKFYKGKIDMLDFANEEQASMEAINRWVSNQTNGMISKLLNEPLNHMTIMVLMNAVYFKGLWHYPFQEKTVWNSFFYMNDGTKKPNITFMLLQEYVNFYEDPVSDHLFLELDYIGQNMSMLFALPKNDAKVPDVEMSSETLCRVRSNFRVTEVVVVLPKFKMDYGRELSKDMIKLGMDEMFSDRADLTGMRKQNDMHVSLMVHQAVIEVNERGTVAAAISGVGIDGRKGLSEQVVFWADHPFLFCIVDKRSDAILFTGRMSDPKK